MQHHKRTTASTAASLLIFTSLAIGGTVSTQKTPPSTLKVSLPKVDYILDPHRMEDAYSMTVDLQLHRGLVRYTPGGDVVPDLAVSWTHDDGRRRYAFKLRKATFSDGTPITAEHVRHSLARLFHVGSSIGADIDYIHGANLFRKTNNLADLGIAALSDDEVEIRLERPSALLTRHLATADCAILKTTDFKAALAFDQHLAVSGPYRLKALDKASITLEKWRADQLDSTNPPGEIVFSFSDATPEELAKAGATDTIDHDPVTPAGKTDLVRSGWREVVTELVAERFIVLNPSVVPLPTRKYLYARVLQDELAHRLGSSSLRPAFGIVPNGMPGALSQEDIAAVRAEAAKVPPPTGEIDLEYVAGHETGVKIVSYLKEVWETGTFKVNLKPLPVETLLKTMFTSRGKVLLGAKGLDYFDGYSVLTYFRGTYESNFFHVHDDAIDGLLNKAVEIFDSDARAAAYKEIQLAILKQFTVIPLVFGSNASGLWSPAVKSVPPHPAGLHTLPLETVEMK